MHPNCTKKRQKNDSRNNMMSTVPGPEMIASKTEYKPIVESPMWMYPGERSLSQTGMAERQQYT